MAFCVHILVAFLLCTCASAVLDLATSEEELVDQVENDVSLLQVAFKVQGHSSNHGTKEQIPSFIVDLDVAPELRWRNVTRHWLDLGVYPVYLWKPTDSALRALAQTVKVDEEYKREMRGIIADVGLPESYVDGLVLNSVGYELSGYRDGPGGIVDTHTGTLSGCSGLLAAMPNGTVVHGRDMDYNGFKMMAKGRILTYPDVTIEVVFVRSGRPLFTTIAWPSGTGIHTAMRFGGWSFEQNTRFHYMDSSILYGLFQGSEGYALAARKIMETTPDFETAVQKLKNLNLMAPGYFVVAGPGAYEGAVITLDRGTNHRPRVPQVMRLSNSTTMLRRDGQVNAGWHIIQTNDDQNSEALDTRRPAEELRLARSTQDMVSPDWVLQEMTTRPVYNTDTLFTTVYVPATGYHKTVVHHGNER